MHGTGPGLQHEPDVRSVHPDRWAGSRDPAVSKKKSSPARETRLLSTGPTLDPQNINNSFTHSEATMARNMPTAAVVAELQVYAAGVGLVLSCRCTRCGSPLFAAKSVSRKLGPVCARLTGGGVDGRR